MAKHIPGPCPYCGTTMQNTGAPVWEDYCPNDECTGHRDEFVRIFRENSSKRQAERRIRDVAPELLDAMKLAVDLVERDVIHARPSDREELLDALAAWRAAISKAEGGPS